MIAIKKKRKKKNDIENKIIGQWYSKDHKKEKVKSSYNLITDKYDGKMFKTYNSKQLSSTGKNGQANFIANSKFNIQNSMGINWNKGMAISFWCKNRSGKHLGIKTLSCKGSICSMTKSFSITTRRYYKSGKKNVPLQVTLVADDRLQKKKNGFKRTRFYLDSYRDKWHNVVLNFKDNKFTIFVDGEKQEVLYLEDGMKIDPSESLYVGQFGKDKFICTGKKCQRIRERNIDQMSEIKIYKKPLSIKFIKNHYKIHKKKISKYS